MYAGIEQNEATWNQGLALDARLTVDEWANRHRVLSSVAAAEPHTSRVSLGSGRQTARHI